MFTIDFPVKWKNIKEIETIITNLKKEYDSNLAGIKTQKAELLVKEKTLEEHSKQLDVKEKQLVEKEKSIASTESKLSLKQSELDSKEQQLREKEQQLVQKENNRMFNHILIIGYIRYERNFTNWTIFSNSNLISLPKNNSVYRREQTVFQFNPFSKGVENALLLSP